MMKSSTKVALAGIAVLFSLFVIVAGIAVSSYIYAYNYGNRTEAQLIAEYDRAQNVLSRTATTVMDVSKVNERYADDLREVIQLSMSGRYGDDGSNATMQWLQEHNISLDSQMYQEINRVVRSGREDFQNAQNRVIDVRRSYTTQLGTLWTGFWMSLAGYPKINLGDYEIILDQTTVERFESGTDSSFL